MLCSAKLAKCLSSERLAGRIRKLKEKLGENLEFRLAFDGELPGSEGGVVVLEKNLCRKFIRVEEVGSEVFGNANGRTCAGVSFSFCQMLC